jgi:hypothetical protein
MSHRYFRNLATTPLYTAYPVIGYYVHNPYIVYGLSNKILNQCVVIEQNQHLPSILTPFLSISKYPVKNFLTDEQLQQEFVDKTFVLNHNIMRKYAVQLYDELHAIQLEKEKNKKDHVEEYRKLVTNAPEFKMEDINKFTSIITNREITRFCNVPAINEIDNCDVNKNITIFNKFKYNGLRYYVQDPCLFILNTINNDNDANEIISVFEVKDT